MKNDAYRSNCQPVTSDVRPFRETNDHVGLVTLFYTPMTQHDKQDVPAARQFYKQAQELLVPLVVITRHCAGGVQVPRALFDNLADFGAAFHNMLCHCLAVLHIVYTTCTTKYKYYIYQNSRRRLAPDPASGPAGPGRPASQPPPIIFF